jgi:hypothetical protein
MSLIFNAFYVYGIMEHSRIVYYSFSLFWVLRKAI